jgi:perosamine synthetase
MRIGRPRQCPDLGLSPLDFFRSIFARAGAETFWPQINGRNAIMTQSARTAIALLRELLGLDVGDEVLMSAYNCGMEVDALLASGLRVRCVDCDRNGFVSLEALQSGVTPATRLLYIIHPFGWPQPLDRIDHWRKERELLLVEDCALALFSHNSDGSPIGRIGDASVFTLRKSLPCPDGGIMTWSGGRFKSGELKPPVLPLRMLGSRGKAWMLRHMRIPRMKFSNVYPSGEWDEYCTPDLPQNYYFEPWRSRRSCSKLTARLIAGFSPENIQERRRRNYLLLSKSLQKRGFSLLFPDLPNGVCPLICPIRIDRRNVTASRFNQLGIEAPPWWAGGHRSIDWKMFPVASELKRTVLPLPVHQQLDSADMEQIADVTQALCQLAQTIGH